MRWGTTIVDQHRSYPHGPQVVRVDNTDTSQLQAAARELQALVLHEQAHHLAEVHAMLAERYRRDGVQIDNAELEVQADDLALLERGDRFLKDVATRLHPGSELLELARQLDDHGLGVWRQAAGSLVDDCPPSLAQLRWEVEEEQRAELRSHAHLIRTEAQLSGLRRRLGLVGRWWHRRRAVELAGQLAECRRRRKRSQQRLAHLDAKLQVIDHTERARSAWIAQAREVLVRGVAAAQVLAEREQQDQDGQRPAAARPSLAVPGSRAQLGAGS
jgi:HPt (histidine-containing phosphotransfer) domain-containing protein